MPSSLTCNFAKPRVDPNMIAEIMRECAQQYIIPRFQHLGAGEVKSKSRPDDLVTIADQETDQAFGRLIPAVVPGAIFIGEEGIAEGRASLDSLQARDQLVFVGDPVDGTGNFAKGSRDFTSMLAAVYNGEVIQGWIYDVMNDSMMIAEKGGGTYLDGKKLAVASHTMIADATGFAAAKDFRPDLRDGISKLAQKFKSVDTLQCAGQEYLRVAKGAAQFAFYEVICPWDHLAGTLSVKEAGGLVRKWDGGVYKAADTSGGLVITANEAIARQFTATVFKPAGRFSPILGN